MCVPLTGSRNRWKKSEPQFALIASRLPSGRKAADQTASVARLPCSFDVTSPSDFQLDAFGDEGCELCSSLELDRLGRRAAHGRAGDEGDQRCPRATRPAG